jgi:hypothetical protein
MNCTWLLITIEIYADAAKVKIRFAIMRDGNVTRGASIKVCTILSWSCQATSLHTCKQSIKSMKIIVYSRNLFLPRLLLVDTLAVHAILSHLGNMGINLPPHKIIQSKSRSILYVMPIYHINPGSRNAMLVRPVRVYVRINPTKPMHNRQYRMQIHAVPTTVSIANVEGKLQEIKETTT